MRLCTLIIAVSAALAAGCNQDSEPRASSNAPAANAPTTASAGASGGSINPAPKGDSVPVPAAPQGSASSADAKPDPGDANDHSNPQHDAKSGKKAD